MNDLAHAVDLAVLPQPGIAVGDATLSADRRLLDEDKPGPAHGELAIVNQMEGRDVAAYRRIHPHWRDDDPVAELDAAECNAFKQLDHCDLPLNWRTGSFAPRRSSCLCNGAGAAQRIDLAAGQAEIFRQDLVIVLTEARGRDVVRHCGIVQHERT